MTADPARAIADAVLYEGYILWPYRRSALKNQRRFTFGGVYPPAHSDAHPDDRCAVAAEVLLRAPAGTPVTATVRFLHVVTRTVWQQRGTELVAVDALDAGGRRHLSWEEAVEREVTAGLALGEPGEATAIAVPGGTESEELPAAAGALRRVWHALEGSLSLAATELGDGLWRLAVQVANATPFCGDREQALLHALCSAHVLLGAPAGEFVSAADPPPELAAAAAGCRSAGLWPVLVGEPGDRTRMLAAPIILEDHPRIAPESPGDLFDGGEIDQLLILNILALTDAEKEEMRATDPRAREILERTEALGPQELMRLHGTVRR